MSVGKKRESLSFYVLVCLMVCFFGLPLGLGFISLAIEQGLTLSYAETQGSIVASEIEETKHKDSSSYTFKVRYAYAVRGREYMGTQVLHGVPIEGLDLVRALSLRFPVDARVPVYYPEDNPSKPVLLRAPEGINLFRLLVSFSLLTGVWWSVYALVREVRRRSRGVLTVVRDGRLHVRWGLGLEGWLVLAVLSLLASNLLPAELMLSLTWGRLALLFVVLTAASVFVESRRQSRLRAGTLDIVWDEQRGVMSLPPERMAGRRTQFELPLSRIQRFHVEKDPNGPKSKGFPDWVLMLSAHDEVAPLKIPVVVWIFEDKVDALWLWLKQRPELKHVQFVPR